jgi:hypothetical protein
VPILNDEDLRDCFAMFAMNGLLNGYQKPDEFTEELLATKAYIVADAMLEARKPKDDGGITSVAKRTYKRKTK